MTLFSSPLLSLLLLLLLCLLVRNAVVEAGEVDEITGLKLMTTDAHDWPFGFETHDDDEAGYAADDDDVAATESPTRRALFWYRMRYYISYGALSANRIPCPPRSGRSYYSHNCYRARGPAHPYSRGCSAITRCRR